MNKQLYSETPKSSDQNCKVVGCLIFQLERIPCDTDKEFFVKEYLERRKVVVLQGCIETWKAKNWTIEGLFNFP